MEAQAKKRRMQLSSKPDALYLISLQTSGAYNYAGTTNTIEIELVGPNAESTGYLSLQHFLQFQFKKGQKDHFRISAKNVGLPILIRIKLDAVFWKNKWFCDFVVVGIQGELENITFPVYDWVVDKMEVAPGNATIPRNITNDQVLAARKREIEANKDMFQWVAKPKEGDLAYGLPRFCNASTVKKLPLILQRDQVRAEHFEFFPIGGLINTAFNSLWLKLKSIWTEPFKNFDDYKNLYKHESLPMDNPKYINNWKTDETMGRQTLTGTSPLIISRCTSIPCYFNVTHDDVANLLDSDKTLEEEIQDGKIYICDYVPLTTGIPRNKHKFCADCVGMFYVKDDDFLPIAIQLVPANRDYLFTPNDSKYDWLLAKMHFRCTSLSIHEWVYHFLYTHNMMEPFCVALFRCLPKAHPVYKLLRPHLQTVCAINTDARKSLIPPGSQANETISLSATATGRAFFKKFNFEDMVIPKLLKKRGTDDADKLPGYYYRDDALRLWKIMESFVGNLLRHYYSSDKDVVRDYELQDWISNVANEGLNWQKNNSNRCPSKLTTIDQLIEVCVTVMFTSSAQHAAVNFGQFETYKFAPNSPSCMRKYPHKKGEGSKEFALESLPDLKQAASIIIITYALSSVTPNEVYIGQFPDLVFTESEVIDMQETYTKELEQLEREIKERNNKLRLQEQYELLIPGRVPKSIDI